MTQIVVIADASSGFAALAAHALAKSRHIVFGPPSCRIGLADLLHPTA